ncbi:MAG: flavin reductase family protein [Hahellaceae bacterium]|nr:flavin reductase family protein [Hahellaceae bacterium]
MNADTETLSGPACYQLLTGAVVPRPIAWISTLSSEGIPNLAPFSFFTVASVYPPVLAVTQVNPRNKPEKDTLVNVRATRECVVNVVSHALLTEMNISSGEYPAGVNEFEIAGLDRIASQRVNAPGVTQAPVRFECRLREIITVGTTPSAGQMMLLDVVHFSVDDRCLNGETIDSRLLDAIGKLGGDGYSTTRDRLDLARPQV